MRRPYFVFGLFTLTPAEPELPGTRTPTLGCAHQWTITLQNGTPARFMTMLLREWVGKRLSGMVVGVGFLWIVFDKHKQGWHDTLMSTGG